MDLALDLVSSWFDLNDENGWIPREIALRRSMLGLGDDFSSNKDLHLS